MSFCILEKRFRHQNLYDCNKQQKHEEFCLLWGKTAPPCCTASHPPPARASITISSTAPALVDDCQKESRAAGWSEPRSYSCCTKSAESRHKMAWVLCLNISHLQSGLMNYSNCAIHCPSHLQWNICPASLSARPDSHHALPQEAFSALLSCGLCPV